MNKKELMKMVGNHKEIVNCTWYSNSTSFWKNTGRKEVFVRYCVGSPSESNWFRGGYEYILYTEKWVF